MTRPTRTSAPVATGVLGVVVVVLAWATVTASSGLVLRWAVETGTGAEVSAPAVVTTGVLLGVMAAPPVRLPLERWDAAGRGTLIVLAGTVLNAAFVTVLGLGVLAAATSAGCAAHAVQVRPTRRQTVRRCVMVVLTTAAALVVQLDGWLAHVTDPGQTVVIVVGQLLVMCPFVVNVASISRRATEAAEMLDVERQRHVGELEHVARHDALTGLLSRRGLEAPSARAAASARPGSCSSLLLADLDGFKAVNDVHGHAAGDALLQEVGRRLRRALRPRDVVGRTGGDEFVVVTTGLADAGEAYDLAERVRSCVEGDVLLDDGSRVGVAASVGVAVTDTGCSGDTLLARADAAMYAAKRARRPGADVPRADAGRRSPVLPGQRPPRDTASPRSGT